MRLSHSIVTCLALAVCIPFGRAVAQVSPDQAVKKILETIDEELTEIDRMLLETSKRESVGDGQATEKLQRMMKDTRGSQERVVRGIDQLIEELQKMQSSQSSGGQGSQQGQPQQRSEDPLEDQGESTRRDNAPPEGMQELRPGQKPQQQNQGEQEDNTQPNAPQAQNVQGEERPDGASERVLREADRAKWGQLPNYELHNHLRGGLPEVPEKYRKFLDEYHRRNQRVRPGGRSSRRR